jgi:biopolymer transport protein ExbD
MHPNVTPLIDVVMCLIIFFMLVAKIGVAVGADKNIDIPLSRLGQELKDSGNALILNVRAGIADEPLVTGLVDKTSTEPVEIKLTDGRGGNPLLDFLKVNRNTNAELKVNIRGDAEMDYRYLEKVLITCMQARIKNLNFNTRPPT